MNNSTFLSKGSKLMMGFLNGGQLLFFSPDQIVRLEAESNYTHIYFTDHSPILMAKVLRKYARILEPHGFIRTHRSHLVNVQYIREYDNEHTIRMTDESQAGISRRKKRAFIETLSHLMITL